MSLLGDLEVFVAVGKTLSFKQAAEALGMPMSTVSRRIAGFERELGFKLLERTTRRVELTALGRQYLSRCQSIVDTAREARDELRGIADAPKGKLRVSMEADIGLLIAPAFEKLHRRHPQIRIDLDLSPRRVDLISEGFDVAIRIGALPDSSLVVRQIASLKVGLYASTAYLRRHGEPGKPADLAGHTRLHLLHQQDDGTWHLKNGRQRAVISGRESLVSANNMSMLGNLARLGMGIAVMDDVMAREDVSRGRIERVLPQWSLPDVPLSILTPSRLIPAKTRAFIESVVAHLQR